jgi:hypothetical protein
MIGSLGLDDRLGHTSIFASIPKQTNHLLVFPGGGVVMSGLYQELALPFDLLRRF